MPLPLQFLATPLSAVYQHFLLKGVSFVAKLQQKTPRIVTQLFLHTFVCFLQIILKKTRLLKFDQEL